ncbi:MAG: type IV pilin-like G/H family protein [Microcoleaceae cyanobacterium MO_207.B10]|nr:type IV pilin-like G/H family protein [Microcoleaceae cyanobacterium MO_207.B10]
MASILSAIATLVIKHPAVTQELDRITSPTKLREKTKSDLLVEQLIGRWKIELPNGTSSVFIFAPNGEFFDLSIPDTAIRFNWVIDRTQPQPQVFVNFGIGILKANLSDSEEMQMRVLPLAPIPNVSSEVLEKFILPASKLSSDYSLPVGRDVIEAEEHYRQRANSAKHSEAKQYISSINMFQKANFWEHQKFIPNIEEIVEKIGIKSQTSNYNYQIFLSEDGRVANVVAIPKGENLRGYFGRVATKSNNTGVTPVAIECESIKPTNKPPSLPLPTIVGGNLECPTDYELLGLSQQRAGFSKQAEARHYMTWINLVQQSQFRRYQKFIPDIQTITQELGIKSQTSNYNYQVFLSEDGSVANVVAIPRDENLRAYVGRVTTKSNTPGVTTIAIRCASLKLTNNFPSL